VHGQERQVEPDTKSQKCQRPAARSGGGRSPLEPVVDRAEDREDQAAHQHEVKVGHDEVGVGELPVEGHHREDDAGEAGAQELKRNAQAKSIGVAKRIRPPYIVAPS